MKRLFNILLLFFFMPIFVNGQTNIPLKKYVSNVTAESKPVVSNHLKLGGTNSWNESIAINNFYFLVNGKPFIPVTGEFHYSRYPNRYWEESLKKIRAGGINIIATYVFWNIHEETEGIFDWDGDKNLRRFIELCEKNDFKVIVRIGPFCHGEIRNGGLPDWLFARPFSVRSNDPEYLAYVETLYKEIGSQLRGYYFSDEAYAYPKINYDYQAPIGQYGQIKPSFHRLKLLHLFMNSFGDKLAPMSLYLPETNSMITPSDTAILRYSVRAKDGAGFIFINNFQDYLDLGNKTGLQIRIRSGKGDVIVPESGGFSLKNGENIILPFNLDLGGINLNYATAQLLTTVGNIKNPCYVFFTPEGTNGEFSLAKTNVSKVSGKSCIIESDPVRWLIKCTGTSEFSISRKGGGEIRVILLDKDLAMKSWQLDIKGIPHLAFSDAMILNGKESAEFLITGKNSFDIFIYPKINSAPKTSDGIIKDNSGESPLMSKFRVDIPEARFEIKTESFGENKMQITFPDQMAEGANDVFLRINYTGDSGMCFVNGELVDDQFYYGHPWEIGLKKFYDRHQFKQMFFYFRPMTRNATYLVDLEKESIPDFSNAQTYLKINNIEIVQEYHGFIKFQ